MSQTSGSNESSEKSKDFNAKFCKYRIDRVEELLLKYPSTRQEGNPVEQTSVTENEEEEGVGMLKKKLT